MIGTNKKDATETVELLLEDAAAGLLARERDAATLEALLGERGVDARRVRGLGGDRRARARPGQPPGRPRVKLSCWDELLEAPRRVAARDRPEKARLDP